MFVRHDGNWEWWFLKSEENQSTWKIALGKSQLQTQVYSTYISSRFRRSNSGHITGRLHHSLLPNPNILLWANITWRLIIKHSEPITVRVQSAGNTRKQQRLACLICDWLTQCPIRSMHARNLRLLQFSPRAEIEAGHCRCAQKSRPQLALR